ncbi:SHOCT domain-containing protein [Lacticaseibacillus zhaodongensis]|uniref:SHOCT domain-containing protein n=1 Tax=Lacticaseibacillus zhaodongensis TaxID=2668065 RepID=UPI001E3492E3|nr:SHOCT domain-containing protein [Lacticaseibacillus zhaodongensis]
MKIEKISEQLKKYGYPEDPSTTVYLEAINGLKGFLGNYAAFTDKYYCASFQRNGIFFMGMGTMRRFKGTTQFVDYKDVSDVTVKSAKLINGRMLLNADKMQIFDGNGGKQAYICYTSFVGEPYWKQNIENAMAVVAAWPPMAERIKQPAPAAQPEAKSVPDQLRDYKKLVDDGVITQDEFDAKKKELLNL